MGKTVQDIACLLDVLLPGRDFGILTKEPETDLSIGVSSERIVDGSAEEEELFLSAQACLGHLISARELRIDLHQEVMEEGHPDTIIRAESSGAWDTYLEGVSGPIRSLQDLVEWHSRHPVSLVKGHVQRCEVN
jgi:hypothetical protein